MRTARWSPDGRFVAAGGDKGKVIVWDWAKRSVVAEFGSFSAVNALAFDPATTLIAAGDAFCTTRIWCLDSPGSLPRVLWDRDFEYFMDDQIGSVRFSSDGRRLLTTTFTWRTVNCWNLETVEHSWAHDCHGGNPGSIDAYFAESGSHVYVTGDASRILEGSNGEIVAKWPELGGWVAGTMRGRCVLGGVGLTVVDDASLTPLYRIFPFSEGDWIVEATSGSLGGAPRGLRRCALRVDGEILPADSFASTMYDPKRVRAAAEGVVLAAPRLPELPRITRARPSDRVVWLKEQPLGLDVQARAGEGLHHFEVDLGGRRLADARVAAATQVSPDGVEASLHLAIDPSEVPSDTDLAIRAADQVGTLSAPLRIRVRRTPR